MPAATQCPDDATLQQLLLGNLAADQFEFLGSHLLECDACAARAGKLDASDALTHSLRAAETMASGQDDTLAKQLRSRLHQLRALQSAQAEPAETISPPTEVSSGAQIATHPVQRSA